MRFVRTSFRIAGSGFLAAQLLVVAVSLYQSSISALGYSRRHRVPQPPAGVLPRFALIVCARNEESVISRIVTDLLAQEYPPELRTVFVVAHNCTDDTASLAARAGAHVIELRTKGPGKSQGVQAGLAALDGTYDLIGVFDADARVAPGLLRGIAAHAEGEACLQAEAVPIEDIDWLAEGYGFGRKARNVFWWRPRAALGLGTTITGSGWFIRPEILARYASGSRTVTEDLELTARLGADGYRVAYVEEAKIAVGEPRLLGDSVKQRLRWVRGHLGVLRYRWPALARRALQGDARAADLAIYMAVPTRLLTRTGVTAAAILGLAGAPYTVPGLLLMPALAGEYAVPAWIAQRERLVRLNKPGFELAIRHGVLSLMWFPIGLWALVTARLTVWEPANRAVVEEKPNVA